MTGHGRSGAYIERALFVPPRFARLLVALTADAERQFRSAGTVFPSELRDWLLDLGDFAGCVVPAVVEVEEPSVWLDVATATSLYRAAGVSLTERAVRQMARDGRLRAKRVGRPWQISVDAVDVDITERKQRKPIGSRYEVDSSQSHVAAALDTLEEAS